MAVTSEFTRDDVPQWEVGLIRWCLIEVFLCAGAIAAINFLEYHKKTQMISGFPKGSVQETDPTKRTDPYKESKKDDPNVKDEEKKENDSQRKDIKPQEDTPKKIVNTINLEVPDDDDYDFIHQLWLYLLFHGICLGVAFHKHFQSGLIALWAYLHAIAFGGFMFLHVSYSVFKVF